MSDAEKAERIHGKSNRDILRGLFGPGLADGDIPALAEEKEALYRSLCLRDSPGLAPGAEEFLSLLRARGIPYAIATSSGARNLDFYFERLGLGAWFDRESTIWDDGTMASKPAPDIFLRAMGRLGRRPGATLVFEDSPSGIKAALASGAGRVVIVDSAGMDTSSFGLERITDFFGAERFLD